MKTNFITQSIDKSCQELESGSFLHFIKDRKGKYLGASQNYLQLMGFSKENEIIGLTGYDLREEKEQTNEHLSHDKEVILAREEKSFIEYGTFSDGIALLLKSYKSPIKLFSKKIVAVSGICFPLIKYDFHNKKMINSKTKLVLTQRQQDCLYYLTKGLTIKRIAKQLGLSPKTIEHYLEAIKIKLNCNNRAELIAIGLQLMTI